MYGSLVEYGGRIKITKDQLPLVKRTLMSCGLCEEKSRLVDSKSYGLKSAVDRTINVHLDCVGLDGTGLSFYYESVLPADASCRIVTQTYETLVCDNK